jgi:DnaJ-class molecular chaperone
MGMDVFGKKPTKKVGEYFRNNVWYWHPLWSYCQHAHPEIVDKVQDGHNNSGDGLDSEDALKLGLLLLQDIENGSVQKYDQNYKDYLANLEQETCHICSGTGIAKYAIESSEPIEKECNSCNGSGKTESWAKNYPFDVENVRQFANFCIHSGGFSIC